MHSGLKNNFAESYRNHWDQWCWESRRTDFEGFWRGNAVAVENLAIHE